MGKMPQEIIRQRRKIKSEKIIHFLQVFEDSNSCTWFVMPLYYCSAFALTRKYLDIPATILLCIVKLAIQALIELHAEGVAHGKLTMRNIMIVEDEDDRYSIKLTNKASHIINTLIYRNITGAHDTFSPSRFAKALQDYDASPDPNFVAEAESEEDGDFSSSDTTTTTTGTVSFTTTSMATSGFAEFLKSDEKRHASASARLSGPNNAMAWKRLQKSEDILAVVRLFARIYDMQVRRLKQERGSTRSARSLNEELGDWDDMLPYIATVNVAATGSSSSVAMPPSVSQIEKLPTLEELLTKRVMVSREDPALELTLFLRKKKMIEGMQSGQQASQSGAVSGTDSGRSSSGSSASQLASSSAGVALNGSTSAMKRVSIAVSASPNGGASNEFDDPPSPPEELSFASGSKREKMLNKLEEACKKGSRRMGISFGRSSASSSPRTSSLKTVRTLMQNIFPGEKKKSGSRSITNLFSTTPPPAGPIPQEEFNVDWIAAFIVFFYNKTFAMWSSVRCECHTMEAGKGKWLWRSQKTGVISNVPARSYFRFLMGAFHDSIFRANVLNSKLPFDLASGEAIFNEFRDHLRRLIRLFLHIAYNHFEPRSPTARDDSEHSSDTEDLASTPRTASALPSSPRSPRSFGKSGKNGPGSVDRGSGKEMSRRQSKDLGRARKDAPNAAELWDYLQEFCSLFRVDMSELELMKKPLFDL